MPRVSGLFYYGYGFWGLDTGFSSEKWARLFGSARQRIEERLVDFEGDAGVAVGDLGDLILGSGPEDLCDFSGGEVVVVRKPLGHVGGGIANSRVE